MPVARRSHGQQSPNGQDTVATRLRPYLFHGVDLTERGSQAVGECPFCGRAGKFTVECDTGLWRCWVCGTGTAAGGGNALVFLRQLHAQVVGACREPFLHMVAAARRLLDSATVTAWGIAPDRGGTWLVPGYGTDGALDQLYRRTWVRDVGRPSGGSWVLMPTPGVWPEGRVHALHLAHATFDARRPAIVVCEGPWDGMALSEVHRSEFGDANIVAVPGCNVWRDEWTALCRGRNVVLLYDSDHPRTENGRTLRAGWDGMYRVAKRLSGVAASVRVVQWGPEGYDPSKPSGWDVRDCLTE